MRRQLRQTHIICAVATLLPSLSAGACATTPEGASWGRNEEEQRIYATVLDSTIAPGSVEQIFVTAQIIPDLTREKTVPAFWRDLYAIPDIDRGTVTDFERSNLFPRRIAGIATTRTRTVVADDSIMQMRPPSAGVVTFSRPGISPNHMQALVMMRASGALTAATWHVLLEKIDSRWRIKHLIRVSAS